jgi:hypothetical protein
MNTARFRPHAHALQGARSVGVPAEFLNLWDILSQVILQPKSEDKHIWRLAASFDYTAKSAYETLKEPFYSVHGSIFGEPGLLTNIAFSCGWSRTISAGLQIVMLGGVNSITRNVCCVIRKRKPSNTYWFLVFSLRISDMNSYRNLECRTLLPNQLSLHLKFGGAGLMRLLLFR